MSGHVFKKGRRAAPAHTETGGGWVCPFSRVEPPRRPKWVGSIDGVDPFGAFGAVLGDIFSRSFFRCFFRSTFVVFWLPKWNQNRSKIDRKSMPRRTSISAPFFNGILMGLGSQSGLPDPQNYWNFIMFYSISLI